MARKQFTKACALCGETFTREYNWSIYCSRKCSRRAQLGTAEQRFDKFVTKDGPNGCWIWSGYRTHFGYGEFGILNQKTRAHRYSWERINGAIPAGLLVLHRCDNPPCVNPDHLFLGTDQDNIVDKVSKGRQNKGETCPTSKLKDEEVLSIRASTDLQRVLASKYQVSRTTISLIRSGKIWKHVSLTAAP